MGGQGSREIVIGAGPVSMARVAPYELSKATMMKTMFALVLILSTDFALADLSPRQGWAVIPTDKPFDQLVTDVKSAVKANEMGVVTQAGPTAAAKRRGIDIAGNRVIGVFNNAFAVRILGLSEAAMIEAPIRLYVTENKDGSATLSYKTPSHVFAPYMADAQGLNIEAAKLDGIFRSITEAAAR